MEKLMTNEIIKKTEKAMVNVYNRNEIIFEYGNGMYLYDVNGKKYLDFSSGIGVCALGYNDEYFNECLKKQIDSLLHTSNLYYNVPLADAVNNVAKATGMDKVFFTNSGAEAVEGALKLARRYAYNKYGNNKNKIISMDNSFHGRTFGALSVTGNEKYQEPFKPLVGNVEFAGYNDVEALKKVVDEETCAIILETIQGEGGIMPCTKEFIETVRELCTEYDIAMICDEIQCGMGRSGYMFAYQEYGILPDIVVCAKAIGNGVPVGAFAAVDKFASAMVPGDHGTTYGGNPFVTSAVNAVFKLFDDKKILDNVKNISVYLEKRLNELVDKYDCVVERRGKGLMQGIVINHSVKNIIDKSLEKGLVVVSARGDVIRFLPPLILEKKHVDEMIVILEDVLTNELQYSNNLI